MKYPPPPPNEQRFESAVNDTIIYATAPGMWHPLARLSKFAQQEAYCIAIVGWQRELRYWASRLAPGDSILTEAAENADAWLDLLEKLK